MYRCPSPPAEPNLDEHQILRRVGFNNAPETVERCLLRPRGPSDAVPKWLVGFHYRLSPALFDIPYVRVFRGNWPFGFGETFERRFVSFGHLFDALPMVQRFEFTNDGALFYSSRRLGSRVVEAWESAKGKSPKYKGLAQVLRNSVGWKCGGMWKKQYCLPENSEAAIIGTNIVANFPMGQYRGIEGRLVLHQEGLPICQEVDPQKAKGLHLFAYSNLNKSFSGTPCPKPLFDNETGELINVLVDYHPGPFSKYRVVSVTSSSDATSGAAPETESIGRVIGKFMARPSLVHSFGLTTDYVIVPIFPLSYSPSDQPSVFRREGGQIDGLYDRLRFDSQDDTLFYVISRKSGCLICVYRGEAGFAFNVANAFQNVDASQLYIDICAYRDSDILEALRLENLREDSTMSKAVLPVPMLRRYHLKNVQLEAGIFYGAAGQMVLFPTATYHVISKMPLEFPTVAPGTIGREHQFVYGLSIKKHDQEKPGVFWNSIVKVSSLYPSEELQWSDLACFPSPPIFIPRPESTEEDDGVLMTQVLDVLRKRSFLLILDAHNFKELGRFWLPVAISTSYLAGCWMQSTLGPQGVPTIPRLAQ